MHTVIFLRDPSGAASLEEVARRVMALLPVSEVEERESENYEGGNYFVGYAANGEVGVCRSDGAQLEEYPYWVTLTYRGVRQGARGMLDEDTSVIAATLATDGLQVFVPEGDWTKVDWAPSGTTYGA
ncbi:hypothetical protein [Variovorax sp. LjRoot178]|uniref:hypothetical protein n=1 Tax=Variovorax sp. LjRoot178 TaxID=3342277 RepID=UPI003ECDCA4B